MYNLDILLSLYVLLHECDPDCTDCPLKLRVYLSPHTFRVIEVRLSSYTSWLLFITQMFWMTVWTQDLLDYPSTYTNTHTWWAIGQCCQKSSYCHSCQTTMDGSLAFRLNVKWSHKHTVTFSSDFFSFYLFCVFLPWQVSGPLCHLHVVQQPKEQMQKGWNRKRVYSTWQFS